MTSSKKLTQFFKDEVRDFSIYACERAIPSGVDGLKPSQRKVVFGMTKRFPTEEVKVSIASATIMAVSCYHHGTMDGVVVNMAQNFPGSNNLPLLEGIGQFGSRISPVAAATRYIFTKLAPTFNKVVSSLDENILEYLEDDGTMVEPRFYLPIIPMVLVNGTDGMGTGYATYIMGYNPTELRDRIIRRLNGQTESTPLIPWYRGFNGKIEKIGEQVVITGSLEVVNTTTIKITELPVGKFTTAYREVLNDLESKGIVKNYDDNSNEEKTEFIVKVAREFTANTSEENMLNVFKLISKNTENLTVWDENRKIRKFASADELLNWFVDYRLTRYDDRKNYLIQSMSSKLIELSEQVRFIEYYLENAATWSKQTADDIFTQLVAARFVRIQELMNIRISKLTGTAIVELKESIKKLEESLQTLKDTTTKNLYKKDLNALKF